MPTPGHNESDTRAKLIDPALHAAAWVERVGEAERATHGEIHREQTAVRIEILDGKPFKRGRGRVDYLLRAFVGEHDHPLTLALSQMKVGKKTPLTLLHFARLFDLLARRGSDAAEAEHSWSVDFAGRLARAREEAAPLHRKAEL